MRIVVCVKYVPDLQSERAFDAQGRVVRDGGDGTLNELDENALQAATDLIAEHDGEVIAVTVGPVGAEDAARRAFQRGADRAVHVLDDAIAGSDVFGTAVCLAAAIRRLDAEAPVDVVLTGMAAGRAHLDDAGGARRRARAAAAHSRRAAHRGGWRRDRPS